MVTARPVLTRRVLAALDATPSRIPVLVGACGSGRTTLVQQVRDRIGRTATHYVAVERAATTPERFLRSLAGLSPFQASPGSPTSARAAFEAALDLFDTAQAGVGLPATFVLDEFLEFQTFESFPGLRHALQDAIDGSRPAPTDSC